MFRCGDFYETYNEDAEAASQILGITKTKHQGAMDITAMAGFPYHALDTYLPKLIRAGKRVAILDQIDGKDIKEVEPEQQPEQKVEEPAPAEPSEVDKLKEQIKELEKKLDETREELEETKYERDEAEAEVNRVAKRVITETVKYFRGDVPTNLNTTYSSVMGKLEYIKLKNACNGKITADEMSFLIAAAEKGAGK